MAESGTGLLIESVSEEASVAGAPGNNLIFWRVFDMVYWSSAAGHQST